MMWMRMPGESWPAGAMQFIGMWIVMMIAMMLPSVLPMLWSYRQLAAAANRERSGLLTLLAGSAYFFVWALLGAVVFLLGTTLAALEMQVPSMARAIPAAAGIVVTIAGALQFSAWKSRSLICCRILPLCCDGSIGTARAAWRIGVRLGLRCVHCCLGMTAVLVVIGVMDLRAMAVLTAAISAERLAPAGQRVARLTGAATLNFGMVLTVRAAIA